MEMNLKKQLLITAAASLFAGSLLAYPVPQQPAPDNTKTNQGDANSGSVTAQQQNENPADRETTRQIRKALMQDKALSTYAHNIKIITRDGRVILKGPVRTQDEKSSIGANAAAIVGADNVTNHLTIAPTNPEL
jgi:hyperosmotically inducible protein